MELSRSAYAGTYLFGNMPDKILPMPMLKPRTHRHGIPQTFQLHVGPSACGRRFSIMSYRRHTRHHRAHLYIDEADVVTGSYEELIPDAVQEILDTAKPRPRAIFISVTCLDDLLGTDHEALRALLSERFPDVRFCTQHIDPIRLDSTSHPRTYMMYQQFRMLDPADEKVDAVNSVGHESPYAQRCELREVLASMGVELRTIAECRTFDDFLDMAKSRLNLVPSNAGRMAADDMAARLGIPALYAPTSYSIARVAGTYDAIADALGKPRPDVSAYRSAAQAKVDWALEVLGDVPIVIDGSFRATPLAHELLDYGFNVRLVLENFILDGDTSDYAWLREHHPEVEVIPSIKAEDHPLSGQAEDLLCIGFGGAYLLGCPHAVFFQDDEQRWGFAAVETLMEAMVRAWEERTDLAAIMAQGEGM